MDDEVRFRGKPSNPDGTGLSKADAWGRLTKGPTIGFD